MVQGEGQTERRRDSLESVEGGIGRQTLGPDTVEVILGDIPTTSSLPSSVPEDLRLRYCETSPDSM